MTGRLNARLKDSLLTNTMKEGKLKMSERELTEEELLQIYEEPYEKNYRLRKMRVFTAEWGSGYVGAYGENEFRTFSKTDEVMAESRLMLEVTVDPTADTKTLIKLLGDVIARLENSDWDEIISVE